MFMTDRHGPALRWLLVCRECLQAEERRWGRSDQGKRVQGAVGPMSGDRLWGVTGSHPEGSDAATETSRRVWVRQVTPWR